MQAVIDNTIPLMYITQLAYRPQLLNPGQPYDFVDMELEGMSTSTSSILDEYRICNRSVGHDRNN